MRDIHWQDISYDDLGQLTIWTQRTPVPNGWLVRTVICDCKEEKEEIRTNSVSMVFISDPEGRWNFD